MTNLSSERRFSVPGTTGGRATPNRSARRPTAPGRPQAASRAIPSVITPAARNAAPSQTSQTKPLGLVRPCPAEEKKKPAGIRIAASGTPDRATQAAKPSSVVASVRIVPTRPRVTKAPAMPWPARGNARWKSVAGIAPVAIGVSTQPPNSMVTTASKRMPATLVASVLSSSMASPSGLLHLGLWTSRRRPEQDARGEQAGRVEGSLDRPHGGYVDRGACQREPRPLGLTDAVLGADASAVLDHQPQHQIGGSIGLRPRDAQQVHVRITLGQVPKHHDLGFGEGGLHPLAQGGHELDMAAHRHGHVELDRGTPQGDRRGVHRLRVAFPVRPQPAARSRLDGRLADLGALAGEGLRYLHGGSP